MPISVCRICDSLHADGTAEQHQGYIWTWHNQYWFLSAASNYHLWGVNWVSAHKMSWSNGYNSSNKTVLFIGSPRWALITHASVITLHVITIINLGVIESQYGMEIRDACCWFSVRVVLSFFSFFAATSYFFLYVEIFWLSWVGSVLRPGDKFD